ncbi:MAG: monovalent cation/H+ antiporter subunit D family protein [Planctomycetota bacterium]|jgi:multicomponent Na+:H+ antiporter subunit D
MAVFAPGIERLVKGGAWVTFLLACAWQFAMACICLDRVLGPDGPWRYQMGNWPQSIGIHYYVDGLNAFVLTAVSGLGTVLAIYAGPSVAKEIPEEKHGIFYALTLLFLVGLGGMTLTGDIFNLYVFIEITSLTSYGLIAMGRRREALLASLNYLFIGIVGATFILLAVGYLYMATGSLDMGAIRLALQQPGATDTTVVRTATALLAVGVSIKVALFPLHLWLPSAYTLAPSAVTALVAGTATKVSAYVMARMLFTVFTPGYLGDKVPVTDAMVFFASVAIIAGPLLALAQTEVKRILAYSSVGQIGYIVLGIVLVDERALTGAIFHIVNHAALKACLFCGVGAVIYRLGVAELEHFNGLAKKMPVTAFTITVAGFSLIGVPLTGGFVAKWYFAWGAIHQGQWLVLPCILISSLISTIYVWRIVHRMYFGDPAHPAYADGHGHHGDDHAPGHEPGTSGLQSPVLREPPWRMRIAMVVLAAVCIYLGTAGRPVVETAGDAARQVQRGAPR